MGVCPVSIRRFSSACRCASDLGEPCASGRRCHGKRRPFQRAELNAGRPQPLEMRVETRGELIRIARPPPERLGEGADPREGVEIDHARVVDVLRPQVRLAAEHMLCRLICEPVGHRVEGEHRVRVDDRADRDRLVRTVRLPVVEVDGGVGG